MPRPRHVWMVRGPRLWAIMGGGARPQRLPQWRSSPGRRLLQGAAKRGYYERVQTSSLHGRHISHYYSMPNDQYSSTLDLNNTEIALPFSKGGVHSNLVWRHLAKDAGQGVPGTAECSGDAPPPLLPTNVVLVPSKRVWDRPYKNYWLPAKTVQSRQVYLRTYRSGNRIP